MSCLARRFFVAQVREELNDGLLNCPDSLISLSIKKEHALRTPLMAAAASGDFAMFTSVKHAVDRAIRVQAVRQKLGGLFRAKAMGGAIVPDLLR